MIKKILNILGLEIRKKQKIKWNCWPKQRSKHVVLFEEDNKFNTTYDKAQHNTQMYATDNPLRRQRHYTLMQLFRNSLLLEGEIVECGTFHGLSAIQIAQIIKENKKKITFHIFDSFEGLSTIEDEDDINQSKELDEKLQVQFAYGEELVKENLKEYKFIKYYKGWIPNRFNEVDNLKFSFVHIDVDLYQPIKDSIDFFYPRLVEGGIMVFDDYGFTAQFPGAKKAVDNAVKKHQPSFFLSLPSGQAFLIK